MNNVKFVLFLIGGRLKRRLRNIILISVIGFGTISIYGKYRRYRWFHEMDECDKTIGTKPRIIVLGTGKKN